MKGKCYSITPFWDKRFTKQHIDLNPILITVNLRRKQFRVGVKLYSTKEDFDAAIKGYGGCERVRELRKEINKSVEKAEQILDLLINPTKESFLRMYKLEMDLPISKNNKTNIVFVFEEKIAEMMKEERFGTAKNCRSALNSLMRYKKELFFEDIDVKFIKDYKAWVESLGCSATTVQIYLRNLKAIFNRAIKAGYIPERLYPFKHYAIGSSVKSRNVLYPNQVKQLWEYQPVGLRESRSKAMFFFCYLCNGMNFKDAAFLKYKNLNGDCLNYVRAKTKRTSMNEKFITVFLHPEAKKIIDVWGNKTNNPNDYIFPFLNNYKTSIKKERAKCRNQRVLNMKLVKIGQKLGFNVHLCLNLARHSFATRLKIDGTPTSFISDAMGHSSTEVTEHYLKSLPIKQYQSISESLLQFN